MKLNFGEVLAALRSGRQAFRQGWNGKNMFIELQVPDQNSKMTKPYIYLTTESCERVPWVASQTDVLATDWILINQI